MVDRRSSYVSKTMVRCSTDVSSIGGYQLRIPNEVRGSRTVMCKGTMDQELLLACSYISGRCCDGQEKDGWVCLPTLGSG